MKSSTIARALSVLLASASAAPAAPETFTLKTVSTNDAFNNLCAEAYHTGAGFADAVMVECTASTPASFYQVGHQLRSNYYGTGIASSGVQINNEEIMYDDWGPVTLQPGNGTENVKYSDTDGFLQTKAYGGAGFIVCEWAHNSAKQLFALSEDSPTIPSTCAFVKLIKG